MNERLKNFFLLRKLHDGTEWNAPRNGSLQDDHAQTQSINS